MNKEKNIENDSKEKEIARFILENPDFYKKYEEIKTYIQTIETQITKNQIPLSVYKNKKLGTLETTVKYLVEENKLRIEQIAKLLNRKYTTIHTTYQKTKQKQPNKFLTKQGELINPKIFSDRTKSPLHSIIAFLKDEKQMRLTDIATALDRDVRNISYTYHKYKRKIQNE